MTLHFFILGRNPELSQAEVRSFLQARKFTYDEVLFEENLLVLDVENQKSPFSIQAFGGVIHTGIVEFSGTEQEFENFAKGNELIPSDKFTYGLFGDADPSILKEIFKFEKKKAMQKHGKKQITFQDGTKDEVPNAEYNIFFHEREGTLYFGYAPHNGDVGRIAERDMEKPIRRAALAISPRLAKILINLSGAQEGDLLLDPFCGVGGILQEALLQGISVHGVDTDGSAIQGAEENLRWLTKNYSLNTKYSLEKADSTRLSDAAFDAVACETPLGVLVKKKPTDSQAQKIIRDFEILIIPILKNLKRIKKDPVRIAITFPIMRSFRVDVAKICKETGLRAVVGPIRESREDQFISRDIVVFI